MEPQVETLKCKAIIIGNSGVGKTSIMNRFCKGFYIDNNSTIGMNAEIKFLQIYDKVVLMTIWDTAGQEKFDSITKLYFRSAMIVLFVYDVTQPKTLYDMDKWFNIVEEEAPPDIIKVLVGNKCDVNFKQISSVEGKEVADYFGMLFYEVSAKDNMHVDLVFISTATMFVELNRDKMLTSQRPSDVLSLRNEENNDLQNTSKCFLYNVYDWLISPYYVYEWFRNSK